jgi:hypothetical protein
VGTLERLAAAVGVLERLAADVEARQWRRLVAVTALRRRWRQP